MKKWCKYLILLFALTFALASCGQVEEPPYVPPVIDDECSEHVDLNEDLVCDICGEKLKGQSQEDETKKVVHKVSLVYNKKIYIPEAGEVITVVWMDDYSKYSSVIETDGIAKKELDGEFNIYLETLPEGYTYNPNIYKSDNENCEIQIELLKIGKISKGKGTALYEEYKIGSAGTFQTKLESKNSKVYYEYTPNRAGYYFIESYVNIYEDSVNPKIDVYTGTFAAKFFSETLDKGGEYKKGGYTRNFKWVVKLSQDQLNNVFTFAVFAESKSGAYPVTVTFRITYEGEYNPDTTVSSLIMAKEADFKTPEYSSSLYTYINSDGGTGSYYAGVTNGTGILDEANFKYNEETGYWHVYNKQTGEFGPILCAKITEPCCYYETGLAYIQMAGNKNLTICDGTENYTQFIEIQYAAACNSDGVCYVTNELKEFLQKFSISQRLFFDGGGFVESTGVYAIEEHQWLFACGYYKENK